jgi:transposase-like protein
LTVKQFCRQEGVSDAAFYQWRKRLQRGPQEAKAVRESRNKRVEASKPFVPVSVPSATFTEVEFPNGVRVRVPATNAEALRVALTTGNEVCREVR